MTPQLNRLAPADDVDDQVDDDTGARPDHEDLQAFLDAHRKPPKQLTVLPGHTITLPKTMPMRIQLDLMKRAGSGQADTNKDDVQLMGELFGGSVCDDLIDAGLGMQEFGLVVTWAIMNLNGRDSSLADAKKAYDTQLASLVDGEEDEDRPDPKARKPRSKTGTPRTS